VKYAKKLEIVEVITFDEFVKYGLTCDDANIVNGILWSFYYHGYPVTNEHNTLYLISTDGYTVKFTPDDVLIYDNCKNLYTYPLTLFKGYYTKIGE
jgi:hypothetical protein